MSLPSASTAFQFTEGPSTSVYTANLTDSPAWSGVSAVNTNTPTLFFSPDQPPSVLKDVKLAPPDSHILIVEISSAPVFSNSMRLFMPRPVLCTVIDDCAAAPARNSPDASSTTKADVATEKRMCFTPLHAPE